MKYLVIIIFLLLSNTFLTAQIAIAPLAGDGSENNPYEIASLENLYWIAASDSIVPVPDQFFRWSAHYIQTADIDATETLDWLGGSGWSTVGYYSGDDNESPFSGSYNGMNYTIDGLTIDRPDTNYIGMFGFTENASLMNIGLTNVNITGGSNVGGLIGYSLENSIIDNCYSTGNIASIVIEGNIGGLIGYNDKTDITNCFSYVNVNGFQNVGGLVGNNSNSLIDNCHAAGDVTSEIGSWRVGGLVGMLSFSVISNCYTTGGASGYNGVGGLAGMRFGSIIADSYTTGAMSGYSTGVGGLVGIDVASIIMNSHSSSNVNGHYYAGGLVGYYTYRPPGRSNGSVPDFISTLLDNYSVSNRLSDDDLTIYNSYSLGDVDGFSYVGGLAGYLTDEATLSKSFSIGNVVGEGQYIGGLAGTHQNSSVIMKSYSTGNVISNSVFDSWAGGLVGENWNSTISNCFSIGNVSGSDYTGGLVGENVTGIIEQSYSIGNVTTSATIAGGLVGSGEGIDRNNYWNTETSGQTTSSMGEGRTTAEMTSPHEVNTYVDWDFTGIWSSDMNYNINNGYPYLTEVPVSVEQEDVYIPLSRTEISLYPNPFNPKVTITLILSREDTDQPVSVEIFNLRGQLVANLLKDQFVRSQELRLYWNGTDDNGRGVTSGIYFVKVSTGSDVAIRKVTLLQ